MKVIVYVEGPSDRLAMEELRRLPAVLQAVCGFFGIVAVNVSRIP